MGEQRSKKRGMKSDTQKRAASHCEYDPMPASGPAGGAHGKPGPDRQSDKDAALGVDSGRRAMRQKAWSERERSEDV
jgi:hypothetical protein